ncbi:MAG: ABC transporter permease [Verrucomicrobia bacterium]|nr:ABC transporter permease [Verrucomicrobiota bacterium]
MNDLRFAVRQLLKHPGFTAVAILTLALGISANATVLGIIHSFFFRPLPVKDADRLAIVMQKTDVVEFPHGFAWLDFKDLRERVEPFEDALALMISPANLGTAGRTPDRTWIEYVSGNYFTMLGVPAALGRTWGPGEGEQPGADPVVVLAHDYWQRQFGGDPSLVGRSIHLNGQPVTVLGVMPQHFSGAQWAMASSAWVPAPMLPQLAEDGRDLLENRDAPAFKIMARLKPGIAAAEARAAADVAVQQIASDHRRDHRPAQGIVVPEMRSRPEPSFSQFMPFAAAVFLGLVLLILLIACANVANLMFARALGRQKEMGIRTALGASRGQLIRQLLVESVLLALAACVVGALLGQAFGVWLGGLAPTGDIPVRNDESWSWQVFAATLLLAVGAGVITGIVPALRATRLDIHTVLKEGGSALVGSTRHPFRSVLVIGQTALAVTVLVCGGLFLESLRRVARQDLGFQTDNLVMASVDLGLQRYPEDQGRRFYQQLLDRLATVPGVKSAALGGHVPFDYSMRLSDVAAEGAATSTDPAAPDGFVSAGFCQISTNYLRTLGITLLQGRDFDARDDATAPPVVLINQHLARRLWGMKTPWASACDSVAATICAKSWGWCATASTSSWEKNSARSSTRPSPSTTPPRPPCMSAANAPPSRWSPPCARPSPNLTRTCPSTTCAPWTSICARARSRSCRCALRPPSPAYRACSVWPSPSWESMASSPTPSANAPGRSASAWPLGPNASTSCAWSYARAGTSP